MSCTPQTKLLSLDFFLAYYDSQHRLENSVLETRMAPLGFYEQQLLCLGVVCMLALTVDRYVSSSTRQTQSKASPEDRLEGGRGSSTALAVLTRQYLLVYAIVMGERRVFPGSPRARRLMKV